MRPDEPGVARDQIEVLSLLDTFESALAKLFHDALLAGADLAHVDRDFAMMHTKVRRAARQISDPGAIEHRLGRRAAIVDARAADVGAFDKRSLPAGLTQCSRERVTRLT